MDLQEIEIVRLQALQAGIDRVEDGCPAQAALVYVVFAALQLLTISDVHDAGLLADSPKALGEQHQFLARQVELLDGLADQDLRDAV